MRGNGSSWTIDPRRLMASSVAVTWTFPVLLKPTANAINVFRVEQADGTAFFNLDATNRRIGLGTEAPGFSFDLSLVSASGNIIQRFQNTSNGSAILGHRFDNWNGDIIGTIYAYSSGAAAGFADNMVYDASRTSSSAHSLRVLGVEVANVSSAGLSLPTVGEGFKIKEGTNATMGSVALVLGTATVSTNKVTANSRIFLQAESLGTITSPVALGVTARSAGTSFTITSANLTDTSTVAWLIVEPA